PMYYGLLMMRGGRADALVAGEEIDYPDAVRPALEVIGVEPGRKHASGIYMMIVRQQTFFFADTTVNIEPDTETLAEIASATAKFVSKLGVEPRVAMLSFSNFGSVKHPAAAKVQRAVALLQEREPDLQVDGEMQADTAVVERILTRVYTNLTPSQLYEHALRRREGVVTPSGPFAAVTSPHTGRSPNDKFIVRELESSDQIWWGKVNQPLDPKQFEQLKADVEAHLQG